jgi:hypothetical protein
MIRMEYEALFTRTATDEGAKILDLNVKMPESMNWIAMVDRLSGGDITKHDLVYERNYIECLNLLSYWWYSDKYQNDIKNANKNNIR